MDLKELEDQFVPSKIAKTVKNKGYDGLCFGYWELNTIVSKIPKLIINCNNRELNEEEQKRPSMFMTLYSNSRLPQWAFAAPTQEQVINWFAEKYDIHLQAFPGFHPGTAQRAYLPMADKIELLDNKRFKKPLNTRREALNIAIEEALKILP